MVQLSLLDLLADVPARPHPDTPRPAISGEFLADPGPVAERVRCGWVSHTDIPCADDRRSIGYQTPRQPWVWAYVCSTHVDDVRAAGAALSIRVRIPLSEPSTHHPVADEAWRLADTGRYAEAIAVLEAADADPPYATGGRTARRTWQDLIDAVRGQQHAAERHLGSHRTG